MLKKARSSGEGTVRTRADETGEARLLIPKEMRPRLGGRTYLYFYGPTEAAAREKRDQAKADLIKDGPGALEPSTLTVEEWLERWLAGPLKRTVSESTYQDYEYRSHTYLIPAIGGVKLKLGHSRITLTLDTYAHVTPHMRGRPSAASGRASHRLPESLSW